MTAVFVCIATKNPREMMPEEKARLAMDAIESTAPCTMARATMLATVDSLSLARLTWKVKQKGKIDRCAMEWKSPMKEAE